MAGCVDKTVAGVRIFEFLVDSLFNISFLMGTTTLKELGEMFNKLNIFFFLGGGVRFL
jgi:hypothetical protein